MDERLERQVTMLHASICQAMSDPKRILILYALSDGPKYVYELAEILDTPQPTVSRHLKTMRERKIVNAERDGTSVRYSLADARVIDALDIMRGVLRDMLTRDAALADQLI
jgi:DNA-binding transcriptional ArsR family regulator